ncbi:type II toxin-antitoxin system RelE/ParE family toxin [Bergeriella denitrificans]|uniref:Plasmid stabilisation system protein n=1 Tax=Bergeriella denitrificans TaxID=494 RepID=A0A378UJ08_BERDE|nr:type II toxin-antitoxin system RelE/ParE family toxin [Bergeriella denitrificans]STZ77326.1 Plasmid stabilisation system protein [Bergeriella denitrificans]
MNILWSNEAEEGLITILAHVADFAGVASAEKYLNEFERLIQLAAANPHMGKAGLIPNTRELFPIRGKYRIVYEIQDDVLWIVALKSTRQLHGE